MPYLLQQTAQSPTNASVNATDLAAQIRAQVNQQLKQAGISDQAAKRAADAAARGVTNVNIPKDGKTSIVQTPHAPAAPVAPVAAPVMVEDADAPATSTTVPPDSPLDIPPRLQDLGFALLLMIAVIAIGKPLVRVFGNIIERRALKTPMPAEFGARLERIEQGIESVSIEVERISESQRYLLKVQQPAPEHMELPRSAS